MFERQDWTLFRNLNTLSQKAGAPLRELRQIVLKELMDNALDAAPGKKPRYGETPEGYYFVEDDGDGIPGTPEQIAALFSIRRPLTSSKILRRPSRGALGNGIRVIAGSVVASGGDLVVHTRGQRIDLDLHDNGSTSAGSVSPSDVQGTRIEIKFGESLPRSRDDWRWARAAAAFEFATVYEGKSSPHWYDSDSFYELLMASGQMPIAKLIGEFEGFAPGGKLYAEAVDRLQGISAEQTQKAESLSREQSDALLDYLRGLSKEIPPEKIGRMQKDAGRGLPYARETGFIEVAPGRGRHKARLPYVVEARAIAKDDQGEDDTIMALVNGTPVAGYLTVERSGRGKIAVFGCGLRNYVEGVSSRKFTVFLNVTIPYMPITTDGKEPDFRRFLEPVQKVLSKSTKKLKTLASRGRQQTDILGRYLPQAIEKASGDGALRFSLRQLFYALRPYVLEQAENKELDYTYFSAWVGKYEAEHGEIPGMYRDPRGTLIHPHTRETIPIGTIAVEEYKRPEWTFNKILYCEKEGLFQILLQSGFPERYDCALLSSKGFASRAVRDLIDLLGDHGEEIHVFCIHDADGPGTAIYESLVEGTTARAARRVKVHNLGLEPWEAVAMGLQVETFERRKQRTVVAKYVGNHEKDYDLKFAPGAELDRDMWGESWVDWLQTRRVELNAMTSPQFLGWLEGKFEEIAAKKVVPPARILEKRLREITEEKLRQRVASDILASAGFDGLIQERMKTMDREGMFGDGEQIAETVISDLENSPEKQWITAVDRVADQLVGARQLGSGK